MSFDTDSWYNIPNGTKNPLKAMGELLNVKNKNNVIQNILLSYTSDKKYESYYSPQICTSRVRIDSDKITLDDENVNMCNYDNTEYNSNLKDDILGTCWGSIPNQNVVEAFTINNSVPDDIFQYYCGTTEYTDD